MQQNRPTLTYQEAFDVYYGGLKGIAGQKLPYTCKCGGTTYPEIDPVSEAKYETSVMNLDACFKHIRKVHKERIVKRRIV